VISILLRPFRLRTWAELAYLLAGGITGVICFTVFVTLASTGLALLVTLLGLPILVGTAYVDRGLAWLERRRAALVLGAPIDETYRRPDRPGVWRFLATLATDPQTWKDAAWMILVFPVGLVGFVAAVVLWATALWGVTFPFYWWLLPADALPRISDEPGLPLDAAIGADLAGARQERGADAFAVDTWPLALAVGAVGLVLLVVTPWVCAALARLQVALARLLLAPGAGERRVGELTRTRAAAADAQASELRRIERDLHDGAQARMVAVTMDLGLAREKLDADPVAARELIDAAHAEATTAVADLRRLVAGIAPAVLSDRGLDAALSSLVASCRVPVSVDVRLPGRVPPAVEVAAYFVVSEALANVQKHASARRATVDVGVRDGRLVVEICDDGHGGADPALGSGLAGLRDRVAALDGSLTVVSPPGGPTTVRAEIPCAS
jgi:signal transduction histidine kinase